MECGDRRLILPKYFGFIWWLSILSNARRFSQGSLCKQVGFPSIILDVLYTLRWCLTSVSQLLALAHDTTQNFKNRTLNLVRSIWKPMLSYFKSAVHSSPSKQPRNLRPKAPLDPIYWRRSHRPVSNLAFRSLRAHMPDIIFWWNRTVRLFSARYPFLAILPWRDRR